MKPPIFVWMSGTLDVFETLAELEQRYTANALNAAEAVVYDSKGRMLAACTEPTGATRIVCDDSQPPHPDKLAELLRGYLQRGGMSAQTVGSLSLPKLIQEVYPSSKPAAQSKRARKTGGIGQPSASHCDVQPGPGPLWRAFGMAICGGSIVAALGWYCALFCSRSLPPRGIGSIGEDLFRLLEGAVVGSLVGGMIVMLLALLHFDVFGSYRGERIGVALIALAVTLVFVGGAVSIIGLIVWARTS